MKHAVVLSSPSARGVRSPSRVECDLLGVDVRVQQLEAVVASMRERLVDHRRKTGAPSQRLERAVAEFDAELTDVRAGLDNLHAGWPWRQCG